MFGLLDIYIYVGIYWKMVGSSQLNLMSQGWNKTNLTVFCHGPLLTLVHMK